MWGVATHDRASLTNPSDTTPLVLLHGLAVSHRYLMPLAARLADRHAVHVVDLPVRHPDRVCGLVLVGPTMDPAARQILRWLHDTAKEDPLQLPILVRDVRDAGLHRVVGTLAYALRDPIEDKLPLVRVPVLSLGAAGSRSCPSRGQRQHPAPAVG